MGLTLGRCYDYKRGVTVKIQGWKLEQQRTVICSSGGTLNDIPLLHQYTASGKNYSDSNNWSLISSEGSQTLIMGTWLFIGLVGWLFFCWCCCVLVWFGIFLLPNRYSESFFSDNVKFSEDELSIFCQLIFSRLGHLSSARSLFQSFHTSFFPSEHKHVPILCCLRQTRHIFLDSINIMQQLKGS